MQVQDLLPGVPIVESPLFEQVAAAMQWDAETARVARDLHEHGFAELDFPDPEFDELAEGIKDRLYAHYDWDSWRAHGWANNTGMRMQDIWGRDDAVKRIACNATILKMLSQIYGRRAWPFQTLNFPVGTQQHLHSDSVHFSTIPEKFMCGVWVALEDISADAGPLVYCPGSHRWPILYNEMVGFRVDKSEDPIDQSIYEETWAALADASKSEVRTFTPKKGRALIWAANLLHGGSRQKDVGVTRWSQVTHYFFDDCCYITPMLSNVFIGQLAVRELNDISTGKPVPNVYIDTPLSDQRDGALEQVWGGLKSFVGMGLPADFDQERYLVLNPDVRAAKVDAATHFLRHGRKEGRRYR
jgi:Phytanoyl-CoA dioxygenase (PhyH)